MCVCPIQLSANEVKGKKKSTIPSDGQYNQERFEEVEFSEKEIQD